MKPMSAFGIGAFALAMRQGASRVLWPTQGPGNRFPTQGDRPGRRASGVMLAGRHASTLKQCQHQVGACTANACRAVGRRPVTTDQLAHILCRGDRKGGPMIQYDSYLLRIWRRRGEGSEEWAGRLEHLQAGTSLGFATRTTLLCHLRAALDSEQQAGPSPLWAEEPAGSAAGLPDKEQPIGGDEA